MKKVSEFKKAMDSSKKTLLVVMFMMGIMVFSPLVSKGELGLGDTAKALKGEATEVAKIAAIAMGVGILIGLVTVIIMFALKKEQAKEYGVYLVIAIVIYTLFFKSVVAELITGTDLIP